MVQKKQTNIRADFFPHGEQYATADADLNDQEHGSEHNTAAPSTGETYSSTKLSPEVQHEVEVGRIILVDWDGPDDPENPMNWTKSKKWINTSLLCMMCLCIGLATAAYGSGVGSMVKDLHSSVELGRLGFTVFNVAFALVPPVLGPLSEFVGAQPVYLICYAGFVIWFIPLFTAKNIWTIVIGRFFSGCFGAAGTTIIPGTLASIWSPNEIGLPVALFTLVAVLGTTASPLYAGYIDVRLGWRAIEWIQMAINGGILILEIAFLREPRGSAILSRRAKKLRKETGDNRYRSPDELETPSLKALLKVSTTRAAIMLITEPTVLFMSLLLSYMWSIIFAFFSAIPIAFSNIRGWSEGNTGLAYIGPIIGTFIGWAFLFHDSHLYNESARKNGGKAIPEVRLYYGAAGTIVSAAGMFIFSFTAPYTWVHWIAPEIGLVLVLIGIVWIFQSVQAYLTDAYGESSSSAIGAQGFVRNLMASSFPLYTTQWFEHMGGFQYTGLFMSLLVTIAIPLPFILIWKGEEIRRRSPYAAAVTGASGESSAPVREAQRHKIDRQVEKPTSVADTDVERISAHADEATLAHQA